MIPRFFALLAACAFSIQGLAQPYPSKPIKIEADMRAEAPALERMVRESGARVE